MRIRSCFHMYHDFDCHFKQDQKNQSDMVDPVLQNKAEIIHEKKENVVFY